jgi:ferredoxin
MSKNFVLYWFSGTGNTLWLARRLSARLEELGNSAALRDITQGADHGPEDTLVFCFPVYSFGMPRIMGDFVAGLKGSNPVAILCTMGGGAGGTVSVAARALAGLGFRVMGGKAVLMPNNYTAGRVPKPESTERLNAEAQKVVADFAQALHQGGAEFRVGSLAGRVSGFANRMFLKSLGAIAKGFSVSPACNGCNVCRRVCPTENITMRGGEPVWGRNCEQCLRCLHLCPENAVSLMGTAKRRRPQYCHPGVKLKDFILRD